VSARSADNRLVSLDGYLSPTAARAAYGALRRFVIPSSHLYIPLRRLGEHDLLAGYAPPVVARLIVRHLHRLAAFAPAPVRARLDGFEVWTTCPNVRSDGQIYLHYDSDEALRASVGALRTPMLGSVLYLGPAEGLQGGETAFVLGGQALSTVTPFAQQSWAEVAGARDVCSVAPLAGRLVLFAGDLLHGQAPVTAQPPGAPRVALLVNLWDARIGDVPEGICCLPAEEFQAKARR
jgi:hypothetical protein